MAKPGAFAAQAILIVQLVLLLELYLAFITTVSASPASVNIYNEIAPGEVVLVNCGSFGERPLMWGEHFGWGFKPSVWGKTRWYCGFKWRNKVQEFYVWVDDGYQGTVPVRPCTQCVWRVRKDGLYRDGHFGFAILTYPWVGA